MSEDKFNKHMWVSQTDLGIDANDVLDFWIEISQEGGNALTLGKIRIPSIFKVRKGYMKHRTTSKRRIPKHN